jgi:hypothetical protein
MSMVHTLFDVQLLVEKRAEDVDLFSELLVLLSQIVQPESVNGLRFNGTLQL